MSRKTVKEPLRILKTPDPIFWQAGFDEERPAPAALESLERGRRPVSGRRPETKTSAPAGAPAPAQPESTSTPPARERVFTRELRNVTGNVLKHRPSAGVRPIRRELRRPLDPPPREESELHEEPPAAAESPAPAPAAEKTSHPLRRLRNHEGEFTPPKSLPPGAERPWLRSIRKETTPDAPDTKSAPPAAEISPAPPLKEEETSPVPPETGAAQAEISPPPPLYSETKPAPPPEVVLLESDDLVSLPEHVRGAARVLQTVVVESESFAAPDEEKAAAAEPVEVPPQAEPDVAPPAVEEPATVLVEVDRTEVGEPAVEEPVVEGPPEPEASTVITAPPVVTADDEEDTSELLDDPDLDAPPMTVTPVVAAVPTAEAIVEESDGGDDPAQPKTQSEAFPDEGLDEEELPEESSSLKDEFFDEIRKGDSDDDLGDIVMSKPASAGPTPGRDTSDPFDVADDDPIFLSPLENENDIEDDFVAGSPRAKGDAPDMEEFLEVDSGLDLELGLDQKIDEHIRESLSEPSPGATQSARTPEGSEEEDILLDDSELADHILHEESGPVPEAVPVVETRSSQDAQEPEQSEESEGPEATAAAQSGVASVPVARPSGEPRISDRLLAETDSPLPDNTTITLQKLYTKRRIESTDFHEILDLVLEKSRADALAFLLLDSMQMVFRTLVGRGLDEASERNLYIGIDDQYVGSESHFQTIRFNSDAMREDFHFKKRFSTDFFERMDGLYIINLHPSGLPGFLVLAYEDLNRLAENVLEITLPPIMRDVLPVLNRYRTIAWEPEHQSAVDSSIVDEIYKLLKHVSRSGRDELCVIHLRFPGLLQQSAWRTRLARIAESLSTAIGPGEKLIRATPERLILVLKETSPDSVIGAARESAGNWGQGLKHRILRYPESGRNFYNYIAPGL